MAATSLRIFAAAAVIVIAAGCRASGTPAALTATGAPSAEESSALPEATVFGGGDSYYERRAHMVAEAIRAAGISDSDVLRAMETTPRHLFVPEQYRGQAYQDRPLPIGYGQTISQPYIVALMTEALELEADDKVLEVGTGSGYQAAILAEIVEQVYTIEIIGALAQRAENVLRRLGYDNVEVRHGDGYFGWEAEAPFDAIVVTAAPDHVPTPLRAQLADGGRLVIPVGPVGGYQQLWVIERNGDEYETRSLGGVIFVPLTRETREE